MSYSLLIGDMAYSSWSLRGWLLFHKFGIPCEVKQTFLYSPAFAESLQCYFPARTVPLIFNDDGVISDSLAIAETLHEQYPKAGIWPSDPRHRSVARTLVSEMHSAFMALREHCPMNLRIAYRDCSPTEAVLSDVARLSEIWSWARKETQSRTPWLCGEYSALDAFYAPVAARIAGYGLQMDAVATAYVQAHLHEHTFRRWRAEGMFVGPHQAVYDRDYQQCAWPYAAKSAEILESLPVGASSENRQCPYSGKTAQDYLIYQGKIYGFCNPTCRNKTAFDPEAFPSFMAMHKP